MPTITLPPGVHDIGDQAMVLDDNTILEGAGIGQTIIKFRGTFDWIQTGIPGSAVIPGNNCHIRDLSIVTESWPYYGGCIGTRMQDGDRPSSNVLIERVHTKGETDNIYIRQDVACVDWKIVDSILETKWDAIVLANGWHTLEVIDSTIVANGVGFQISGSPQNANCTTVLSGFLALDECDLTATAGAAQVSRGLWTLNDAGYIPGARIETMGHTIVRANIPVSAVAGSLIKNRTQTRLIVT